MVASDGWAFAGMGTRFTWTIQNPYLGGLCPLFVRYAPIKLGIVQQGAGRVWDVAGSHDHEMQDVETRCKTLNPEADVAGRLHLTRSPRISVCHHAGIALLL